MRATSGGDPSSQPHRKRRRPAYAYTATTTAAVAAVLCSCACFCAAAVAAAAAVPSSGTHAGPVPGSSASVVPASTALQDFDTLIARLQQERSQAHARYLAHSSHHAAAGSRPSQSQKRGPAQPVAQRRALAPSNTTTTSVDIANKANSLLFVPVSIGTTEEKQHGITVLLQLSTAVSDWWVLNYAFDKYLVPYDHDGVSIPDFLVPPSSTLNYTGHSYNTTQVDGTVIRAGFQVSDVVRFASRTVENQVWNIANVTSEAIPVFPAFGVAGLGWPALANQQALPFWQSSGANVFSFWLTASPNSANSYAFGGKLYLGPPPPPAPEPSSNASSPYVGNITYFPLLAGAGNETTWTISLSQLRVHNSTVPLPGSTGRTQALLDTGTATIATPDAVASAFYARVPGAEPVPQSPGFWWYPCNHTDQLAQPFLSPSASLHITLAFGEGDPAAEGNSYTIPDGLFGTPTTVPASGQITGFDVDGDILGNGTEPARRGYAATEGKGRRADQRGGIAPSDQRGAASASPQRRDVTGLVQCVGALYGYGDLTTGANNSTTLAAADAGTEPSQAATRGDLVIVGLPFLQSVFSVFDGTIPAIGFANLADPPLSASSLARAAGSPEWFPAFRAGSPDRTGNGVPGPVESGDPGLPPSSGSKPTPTSSRASAPGRRGVGLSSLIVVALSAGAVLLVADGLAGWL